MKICKKIYPIFLTLYLLVSCTSLAWADVKFPKYTPLVNLPDQSGPIDTSGTNLSKYLSGLYAFGVAAAAGLAVIMVILGGIQYITSVAGEGKSGGKQRITSAILGLLLALGSYIILNTINKDLLKLSFDLKTVAPVYNGTAEQKAALQRVVNDIQNRTNTLTQGINDAQFAIWSRTLHYEDMGYNSAGDHSVQRINFAYAGNIDSPGTTAIAPIGTYKIGDKIFIQSLSGKETSTYQISNGIVTVTGINNDPFAPLRVNMGYMVPNTNLQNQPSNVILR